MSKKVGIVLSGCGVNDGTEIHEAVMLLHSVVKHGGTPIFMAPDIEQYAVIDHRNGHLMKEHRNVLVESSRLSRSNVMDISNIHGSDLDALIFPGGFGAAKNLSDMGLHENIEDMVVELHTQQLIEEMYEAKKPIGFICVSAASVGAIALHGKGIKLTIGHDEKMAKVITSLGNTHIDSGAGEIVVDEDKKIVSTPAYMNTGNIVEMAKGVDSLVDQVFAFMDSD